MYASGFTIDSWTNCSSGCPARCANRRPAYRGRGRSFRCSPAAFSVWQAPQPLFTKTALPAAAPPPPPPVVVVDLLTHASPVGLAHHEHGRAHDGVSEAAELGADDRVGADLVRRDRHVRGRSPGRRPASGRTPAPRRSGGRRAPDSVKRAGRSTGSRSTLVVSFFSSGYLNVQANCCAVTLMRTRVGAGAVVPGEDDRRDDRPSTSRARTGSPSSRSPGPCGRGSAAPSESSSGATRNFHAAYTSAAMTIA